MACGHGNAVLTTADGQTFCSFECAHKQLKDVKVVGFSITQPTGTLESVISWWYGGFGATHQYITALATSKLIPMKVTEERLSAKRLVQGVIWNDFPLEDERDGKGEYDKILVRMSEAEAPYIEDDRFRWQPSEADRFASAAAYKAGGSPLSQLVSNWKGVTKEKAEEAEAMLERRSGTLKSHYHFLRERAEETDKSVRERAVSTCIRWYEHAVESRDLFTLGHVFHTIEDSYSPAHTMRLVPKTEVDFGRITEVYYFGNQNDTNHSRQEGIQQAQSSSYAAYDRVQWCVHALKYIYGRFQEDLHTVHDPGWDRRAKLVGVVKKMESILNDQIFAM